jgi:hypothetical protein
MKKSRYSEEQIIRILKQHEARVDGRSVPGARDQRGNVLQLQGEVRGAGQKIPSIGTGTELRDGWRKARTALELDPKHDLISRMRTLLATPEESFSRTPPRYCIVCCAVRRPALTAAPASTQILCQAT